MSTNVKVEIGGGLAELTLSPLEGKPPTLDRSTLLALDDCLRDLGEDPRIRLLVLRSSSPRHFCVGANINVLATLDATTIGAWVELGHAVFSRLEDLPFPVVARVEGNALGGGLELAMAADLIFGSETARFGQPEARLGLVGGWGGTWRLPRRVGVARAKELFFSGRIISATEAYEIKLMDFCGTAEALTQRLQQLLDDTSKCTAAAVRECKRLIGAAPSLGRQQAREAEAVASEKCMRSSETKAAIDDFLRGKK